MMFVYNILCYLTNYHHLLDLRLSYGTHGKLSTSSQWQITEPLTLPCTGGGRFPPPLPTLKPHSSLRSLSLCPIFISTWSHGHPLWPWLKKSTKKSFVFELYNLWRNDQKSPYNVGLIKIVRSVSYFFFGATTYN